MPDIGASLREARMRARIDVSEIEAQTKIRAKYLRALENEEWDLLPGPTYVKSFLRTYAEALDLDAKLLVDEYKLRHERLSEVELQPINAAAPGRERRRQTPILPPWFFVAVIFVGPHLRAVSARHDGRRSATSRRSPPRRRRGRQRQQQPPPPAAQEPARPSTVAVADRGDRAGVRLPAGRRPHAHRRADAAGRPAHAHVPLAPLPAHRRQQRRPACGSTAVPAPSRRRRTRSACEITPDRGRQPLSRRQAPGLHVSAAR